jgi:hypothetical protein
MNIYPFLFPAQSGSVSNPFDKTNPDITVFGATLSAKAFLVLGGIWGFAMLACAVWLVIGIAKFGHAKRVNHNPDALSDAAKLIYTPLISIACLGGVGTIFGAAAGLFG